VDGSGRAPHSPALELAGDWRTSQWTRRETAPIQLVGWRGSSARPRVGAAAPRTRTTVAVPSEWRTDRDDGATRGCSHVRRSDRAGYARHDLAVSHPAPPTEGRTACGSDVRTRGLIGLTATRPRPRSRACERAKTGGHTTQGNENESSGIGQKHMKWDCT